MFFCPLDIPYMYMYMAFCSPKWTAENLKAVKKTLLHVHTQLTASPFFLLFPHLLLPSPFPSSSLFPSSPLSTLDNKEMYEQCAYFSLPDLMEMGDFLNQLVFRLIWDYKATSPSHSTLLTHAHSLLLHLHSRDARKPFCPPDHWLLK